MCVFSQSQNQEVSDHQNTDHAHHCPAAAPQTACFLSRVLESLTWTLCCHVSEDTPFPRGMNSKDGVASQRAMPEAATANTRVLLRLRPNPTVATAFLHTYQRRHLVPLCPSLWLIPDCSSKVTFILLNYMGVSPLPPPTNSALGKCSRALL